MSYKVVCKNDKGMPKDFPAKYWVKSGEVYTVIDAKEMAYNRKALGYKLEEIEMPEDCVYQYFLANRFVPQSDDLEAEMAMQELLDEVNEIVPEVQGVVGQLRRCVRTVYLPTHTLVPES
jgi:hypothetical protein